MTDQHPITPPPELVEKWNNLPLSTEEIIAIAWRNGADTELEACCEWMSSRTVVSPSELRAARRPKPPSLKEQALKALKHAEEGWRPVPADCEIIRRALESLPDNIA